MRPATKRHLRLFLRVLIAGTLVGLAYGALTDQDIEALSNEPPLPFFILFEAMQQTDGLQLGLLGSIIISETIFGALASDLRGAVDALTQEIDTQLAYVQLEGQVARAWTYLHFLHDSGVSP